MPRTELLCPLCGVKAETYTTPGNLYIKCPTCGWYRLTYLAHERFFMGHGSPVLTKEQRMRLGDRIRREFAERPDSPVELTIDSIRELLGIEESAERDSAKGAVPGQDTGTPVRKP